MQRKFQVGENKINEHGNNFDNCSVSPCINFLARKLSERICLGYKSVKNILILPTHSVAKYSTFKPGKSWTDFSLRNLFDWKNFEAHAPKKSSFSVKMHCFFLLSADFFKVPTLWKYTNARTACCIWCQKLVKKANFVTYT